MAATTNTKTSLDDKAAVVDGAHPNGHHHHHHNNEFIEKYEHMPLGYGDDRHDLAVKEGLKTQLEAPGVHQHVSCTVVLRSILKSPKLTLLLLAR